MPIQDIYFISLLNKEITEEKFIGCAVFCIILFFFIIINDLVEHLINHKKIEHNNFSEDFEYIFGIILIIIVIIITAFVIIIAAVGIVNMFLFILKKCSTRCSKERETSDETLTEPLV